MNVKRSMIEGPSSESNSSCALASEKSLRQTKGHTYQGDNVVEKMCLTDSHAEPHRMVGIHDMDMETICASRVSESSRDGRGDAQ